MTNDIKRPTDADLARMLRRRERAITQNTPSGRCISVTEDLPALVAALREAWEVVALGHKIADSYEWGECQDADQREFTNRAARIVKEVK